MKKILLFLIILLTACTQVQSQRKSELIYAKPEIKTYQIIIYSSTYFLAPIWSEELTGVLTNYADGRFEIVLKTGEKYIYYPSFQFLVIIKETRK